MYSSNSGRRDGPGPIPTRWLNCPRKSAKLIGEKFLALKTPLSHKFDDQVPLQNQFPPSMLFSSMKSHKVKIGLWIDLTNTDRFYDRNEVEKQGAKYIKLKCRGFGECPSEEQVKTFVTICDTFIRKNPLEIIAVHCTHGFNRSGVMISSYFIEKEDWSCDRAVIEFALARPPGIYKADYINELYKRYDDAADAPKPPPLPEWSLEVEEDDEGIEGDVDPNKVNGNFNGQMNGGKKRVAMKFKPSLFMEGVPGVTQIADEPRLTAIQRKVQNMCGFTQSGFPGCQPVSMTRENLAMLSESPYKVSWKADGTRYMMLIDGKSQVYFADRDHSIFHAPNVDFRQKHNLKDYLCDTLLDGEMVIDTDPKTHKKFPRYLIYDAIRIQGRDIMYDNFHLRFERITTDIISPRHAAIENGLIDKLKESFGVRRKDFWETAPAMVHKLLSSDFKKQLAHEPDGLIFQPESDPYVVGRCDRCLKWKPSSMNSVDFKLKIVITRGEGLLPTKEGELYVGGMVMPFGQMKVTKDIKELSGKIIECKMDAKNNWVFMRERTDKSFPNGYNTAVGVCNSIMHPVTEQMLLDFIHTKGWKKPDRELMPPPAKRQKRSLD